MIGSFSFFGRKRSPTNQEKKFIEPKIGLTAKKIKNTSERKEGIDKREKERKKDTHIFL